MHLYHTASSPTSTIRRPAGAVDPPARGPTRCHPTSTRSRSDNSRPPSEIGHLKNLICKMWLKMKIFMGFSVAFAYMLVMGNTTPNCGKKSGYVGIWWDMLKYWYDCYIRVVSEKVYGENDEPMNLRVSMGILFLMGPGHISSLVTNMYQRHRELDGPNMAFDATEQRTTSGKVAWSGLDGPKRLQRIRDVVKRLSAVVFHDKEQGWGIGDSEDTLSNGPNTLKILLI